MVVNINTAIIAIIYGSFISIPFLSFTMYYNYLNKNMTVLQFIFREQKSCIKQLFPVRYVLALTSVFLRRIPESQKLK